jgi:glycosyltransferase involved in cell wall biosynthesis
VDAGGPLEFVRHEETGLIAADDEAAIAIALDRLAADATLARDLGARARESVRAIRWEPVLDALTETLG